MDDADISSKFEDYETDVGGFMKLVDVYKNNTKHSREELVNRIEEASDKAIDLIKRLKAELIKDAVDNLNNQVDEYESYQAELMRSLRSVRGSVTDAQNNALPIRSVAIKLNKAIYALEKPSQKLFSFLEQWEDLSKCDIGIIVIDSVHERKPRPSSDRRPLRKSLETPTSVRLPMTSSARKTVGYEPAPAKAVLSSSNSSFDTSRDGLLAKQELETSESYFVNEKPKKPEVIVIGDSDSDSEGSDLEVVAFMKSAVQQWNDLAGNDASSEYVKPQSGGGGDVGGGGDFGGGGDLGRGGDVGGGGDVGANTQTSNHDESVVDWQIVDEWEASAETELSSSHPYKNESGDSPGTPSINISFSSLRIADTAAPSPAPIRINTSITEFGRTPVQSPPHRSVKLKLGGAQTPFSQGSERADIAEMRSGCLPSVRSEEFEHTDNSAIPVIARYLSQSTKSKVQAKLSNVLRAPATALNFPIGTCFYESGLVVCNSGDSKVFHVVYGEGTGSRCTELKGSFVRPSAVVIDQTNHLFIKDNHCIQRYGPDLQLQKIFPNCKLRPYGLAVTPDNHLITMCDCGVGRGVPRSPSLLKYNVDGDLISTIPLRLPLTGSTKLRFMDIFGDNIYISDLGASFVYWADVNTGRLIRVIAKPGRDAGQFNEPSGIACDKAGNLLIADSRSNRIQIFDSEDRAYRGMLHFEVGLSRPSGIYLDSSDRLYAVNYIAHKVNAYDLLLD